MSSWECFSNRSPVISDASSAREAGMLVAHVSHTRSMPTVTSIPAWDWRARMPTARAQLYRADRVALHRAPCLRFAKARFASAMQCGRYRALPSRLARTTVRIGQEPVFHADGERPNNLRKGLCGSLAIARRVEQVNQTCNVARRFWQLRRHARGDASRNRVRGGVAGELDDRRPEFRVAVSRIQPNIMQRIGKRGASMSAKPGFATKRALTAPIFSGSMNRRLAA